MTAMTSPMFNSTLVRVAENRRTAHRMAGRGQSVGQIAAELKITKRTVFRYLQDPPPPPAPLLPEVDLASFYMLGACFGRYDIEWTTERPDQIEAAKSVCATCPVMQRCRAYGVGKGLGDEGIWGGLTKPERRRKAAGAPAKTVVA